MIHHPTESAPLSDHYAVGCSGMSSKVLVQLQEKGSQVRVALTAQEARHFARLLLLQADSVEQMDCARS